jgi:D-serine dehydratase
MQEGVDLADGPGGVDFGRLPSLGAEAGDVRFGSPTVRPCALLSTGA